MDTDPDEVAAWVAMLDANETVPTWSKPGDLGRMSVQAFWQQAAPSRVVRSEGALHLEGAETANHSARLTSLGTMLTTFQSLVTAMGAAIEGIKSKAGQLPADLVLKTQLRQTAPLGVGSVVVNFAPEQIPSEELVGDKGVALLDQPDEQFVDRCVRDALTLLRHAHELDADADSSELLQTVVEGGPRLATALRAFAKAVSQSAFRLETSWAQPDHGVEHATFTPADAAQIEQLIRVRDLDTEPVVITGSIFASSVKGRWQLDIGEPGVVALDLSKVQGGLTYQEFPLYQRVEVQARPRVHEFPGGSASTTYVVETITALPDED
jgi:hypothetical protein